MFLKKRESVQVRMFFELMGWPKEAINEHLKKIVDTLKKRIKVTKEEYAEPEKIGEKMYTSHVEFEAEIPTLRDLFIITLEFGPSVIELLDPPEVIVTAQDLQEILADISAKVTSMDKDMKILAARLRQAMNVIKSAQNMPKNKKEDENKEIEDNPNFTIKK
jgi:hypothetical protein